jgi:hypothetical protein
MTITIATGVWAVQLLATVGMLIAAFIEIEWIMVTGPLLSVAGLLMATFARRLQSAAVLCYGLSGPLVCALCAALIAINRWGPVESWLSIGVIIVAYAVLSAPLAFVSIRQIRRPQAESAIGQHRAWQFSLRTMLILVTSVCVSIAVARFFFQNVSPGEHVMFGSYALVCSLLSAGIAWRFVAARSAIAVSP